MHYIIIETTLIRVTCFRVVKCANTMSSTEEPIPFIKGAVLEGLLSLSVSKSTEPLANVS